MASSWLAAESEVFRGGCGCEGDDEEDAKYAEFLRRKGEQQRTGPPPTSAPVGPSSTSALTVETAPAAVAPRSTRAALEAEDAQRSEALRRIQEREERLQLYGTAGGAITAPVSPGALDEALRSNERAQREDATTFVQAFR